MEMNVLDVAEWPCCLTRRIRNKLPQPISYLIVVVIRKVPANTAENSQRRRRFAALKSGQALELLSAAMAIFQEQVQVRRYVGCF